jgi:hypothetical protein
VPSLCASPYAAVSADDRKIPWFSFFGQVFQLGSSLAPCQYVQTVDPVLNHASQTSVTSQGLAPEMTLSKKVCWPTGSQLITEYCGSRVAPGNYCSCLAFLDRVRGLNVPLYHNPRTRTRYSRSTARARGIDTPPKSLLRLFFPSVQYSTGNFLLLHRDCCRPKSDAETSSPRVASLSPAGSGNHRDA